MMYDSQVHFHNLYQQAPMEFTFRAGSIAEFEQWQAAFRPRLKQILGLERIEAQLRGYQPGAQQVDETDLGEFVRQRWVIWVEPSVPLPFIVLLPKNISGPLPLVITPHGHGKNTELYAGVYHNPEEYASMVDGERDIAVQAVREGYIAIAPTARAFGETRTQADKEEDKTSSCRVQLLHDLLVGRTPIGDRVWDMSRLIDWAFANLPVDPRRVVMTGNSGGGTVSVFAPACDERITLAAPGSYFCTFQGSIGTLYHCDCNYVPGILTLGEMYDVAGLIAPRPFVAMAGRQDSIFPIDQVQFAMEKLKSIYTVAGVPERCELHIGEGGHRYYKQGSWPFIRRQFAAITN
jgi:dienelactone hydrolase